ncbi:SDR family oxidoreductase [Mycolicibacterium goodii]|uniref:SDR family oxidoreductase n=1 Tax=Mycolicibacterium goodii TaxID=134601 RepID=UPI001BDD0BA9|nr:SDR family oxidoreductase [Mycolicibacterium goodii]MBU8828756.1 SDR family oxidoreductase [Mycolicibacterium goodii]
MRVFVTGASGHVASAVVPELVSAGHSVIGLARSNRSAGVVESLGAQACRGDLAEREVLRAQSREADAVIHLAFPNYEQNSGNLASAVSTDLEAIHAISDALVGSDKPFVVTSATGAMALAGFTGVLHERDALPRGPRIEAENTVIALAEKKVRTSIIRLPPTVHGGGVHGFASGLVSLAQARGTVGYLGSGDNRWPSAHVKDVALLYRLALEAAPPGTRLHAVAEKGIPVRKIAETIGRKLNLPVASIAPEEAQQHFEFLSAFIGMDNPTSSEYTRDTLGWTPTHPGLLADLEQDAQLKPCLANEATGS